MPPTPPPPRSESDSASTSALPQTPVKSQPRIPQSAPAASRTQQLLTSPAAAQRSKASLEAFKVARALKEGFLKLKARADPSLLSPTASRYSQRAFSANTPRRSQQSRQNSLVRHNSELPRSGSFDSSPLPDTSQTRPSLLYPAHSCPQHQRRPKSNHFTGTRLPAPRFLLSQKEEESKLNGTEVAEAAEAMILFMKSEPSSQNEPVSPSLQSAAASGLSGPGLDRSSSTETESIVLSDSENVGLSNTRLAASASYSPPTQVQSQATTSAKRSRNGAEIADVGQSPRKRPVTESLAIP
ncbi:hypothetical protein LPJ55_001774 [Coemansia sp. RSA 990]|nr:hypothetical protein LPJ68_000995 [Coemansia sp. RSA 1086]KAJ1751997.1 hypothetical protein LPJ79_001624 [Coemansia sp. RSA 1821]KAJ1874071.1 hypothetical protein LPJ55_001774 [Coemansia sp. RSA 990]KAJ2671255.1 hypothetical protein IWW42_003517 [Coemansia sp. RSA 1085]